MLIIVFHSIDIMSNLFKLVWSSLDSGSEMSSLPSFVTSPRCLWVLDHQDRQGQPEGKNDSLRRYQRSGHLTTIRTQWTRTAMSRLYCFLLISMLGVQSIHLVTILVVCFSQRNFLRSHSSLRGLYLRICVSKLCSEGLRICWALAWGVFGSGFNGYFTFFTRFYLVIQLDTTYLQAWALMYLWQLTLDLTCLCFCMFLKTNLLSKKY
jgi:hypothetical protein